MFEAELDFAEGVAHRVEVAAIHRTGLHRHPGVVEILYVLRGQLRVEVSCETFELKTGDFAVLNHGDPHSLDGSADNVTATVHLDMAGFRDVDRFADVIIFACESFDLPRYRKQEGMLRGLLLDIVEAHVTVTQQNGTSSGLSRFEREQCRTLVRILCTAYSLEHYYNRGIQVTSARRDKYLSVLRALRDYDDKRNALELIAAREHFSKSYVSHLVKDVAATSFSDMLTFIRLCRAERMLLTTNATMLQISERCGFSDVKYFTRGFLDWFHRSPVEYRKSRSPRILEDDIVGEVSAAEAVVLFAENRRRVASADEDPQLSITPLLLKNVGSRVDLFDAVRTRRHEPHVLAERIGQPAFGGGRPHLVPVRIVAADIHSGYVLETLSSFRQINAVPSLVVQYGSRDSTLELLRSLAVNLLGIGTTSVPIWLVYSGLHERFAVDDILELIEAEHGVAVQAILTS